LIAFSITAAISPRQIPNPIIASPIAAIKIPIREEYRKRPVVPLRFEDKNPILKSTPFHTLILPDCLINIQHNFFHPPNKILTADEICREYRLRNSFRLCGQRSGEQHSRNYFFLP
jgi:hypothetical protein